MEFRIEPVGSSVGPEDYKRALRKFASGLTVVTVADGDEVHGMTASSFASVSLRPPLVLVCLEKTSRTRALVLASRTFAVNVLAEGQEWTARAFSQAGAKPFDRLAHRRGITGAPLFEGALAWLECGIAEVVEAGDHDIVIGDVIWCDAAEGAPLIHFDQANRSLRDI